MSDRIPTTSHHLTNRWGALGRREDGLAAIEEAGTIRRELTVRRPDVIPAP